MGLMLIDRLVVQGDCREVMRQMSESSVDAVVTDPPYELNFMGRGWDNAGVAFDPATWREVLRVLKTGGHMLVFGGTRTHHRVMVAVEDAGFEIRDCLQWLYGSGFPKSMNISKAIDKQLVNGPNGAAEEERDWDGFGTALKPAYEPIILARKPLKGTVVKNVLAHGTGALNIDGCRVSTTDDLNGGDYAESSIGRGGGVWRGSRKGDTRSMQNAGAGEYEQPPGRWPANVLLTHHPDCEVVGQQVVKGDQRQTGDGKRGSGFVNVGSDAGDGEPNAHVYGDQEIEVFACHPDCPVRLLDKQTVKLKRGGDLSGNEPTAEGFSGVVYGDGKSREGWTAYGDKGGASRFFYCSKASSKERNAGLEGRNRHPTVKPVDLMRWLIRLVTPPDGLILDPFAGSGTTGIASLHEGFRFMGIEQDEDYCSIARARIEHAAREAREKVAA